MKRLLVSGLAAGALLVGLAVPPAQASPAPGVFAPALELATGVIQFGPAAAELTDGTVAVVWQPAGDSFGVRIRRAGATSFGATMTKTLAAGHTLGISGSPTNSPVIKLLALTSTSFLLGWADCVGAACSVQVSTLGASAASIPASVKVSGSDVATTFEPTFAVLPDGSAAAGWLVTSGGGYSLRVSQRTGVAGAWSAASTAGLTSLPFDYQVALDSTRSLSALWMSMPGVLYEFRVRSRIGSTWGLPVVASSFNPSVFTSLTGLASLTAGGSSTVLAVIESMSGTSNYADTNPMAVRVLQRTSSSTNWTLTSQVLTGPGRYATSPALSMTVDGSAVLRFADFETGVVGTPTTYQISTFLVQRRGAAGSWTAPTMVDASSVLDPLSSYSMSRFRPMMLDDGTYVTPSLQPLVDPGPPETAVAGFGIQTRGSWTGLMSDGPVMGQTMSMGVAAALVNASGRTTVMYVGPTANLNVRTSTLPKPFVRSKATLSKSAPRKGQAVACTSAWSEAASLAYKWLRNGSIISGATSKTYTPKSADVGRALSCRVTGTNSKGSVASTSVARTVGS